MGLGNKIKILGSVKGKKSAESWRQENYILDKAQIFNNLISWYVVRGHLPTGEPTPPKSGTLIMP